MAFAAEPVALHGESEQQGRRLANMPPEQRTARIVHVVAMLAIAGVVFAAVAVATSAAGTSRTTQASCGKERWDVKTLKMTRQRRCC